MRECRKLFHRRRCEINMLDYTRIILVEPTHPGNIGATARAMANFGARDLVLVNPKNFPSEIANARAVGAGEILANARVCADLDAALGDCVFAAGATARPREIAAPTLSPAAAAEELHARFANAGKPVALVFGRESSGLTNAELERCQKLIRVPTLDASASLNLAVAAAIVLYEIRKISISPPAAKCAEAPATAAELRDFYRHAREFLAQIEFGESPATKLHRRLAVFVNRAEPSAREIRTLRGVFTAAQRKLRG